jgi:hypothetical protein
VLGWIDRLRLCFCSGLRIGLRSGEALARGRLADRFADRNRHGGVGPENP